MGKVKILYVSHSARSGGAEVCLLTLVKFLDRSRFEPVVVLPARGPLRSRLEQAGVRTYVSALEWWIRAPVEFSYKGSALGRRVQLLAAIIESERPALVHTNTSVIWEGALAAALTGTPHLWHLHEILPTHPVLRPLLPLAEVYHDINTLSHRIVAVSEAVRDSFRGAVANGKMTVIPNGIDTRRFETAPAGTLGATLREEFALPPGGVVAIMIASLVPEKGHDVLLGAAKLLERKDVTVHFLLVGGGNPLAVQSLRRRISALGLNDRVHYLGLRHDVPRLLQGSDFLVLPSLSDAFPLAVLESMAAGIPAVASASGGASEMIVDDESGFVVPVADPVALSERIADMASDKERRHMMARAALRRFQANYTAERYAERFQRCYEQLVERSRLAPDNLSSAADVRARMREYERAYYQSQMTARRRHPARWQIGRLVRWAKHQARRRMYEVE